MVYYGAEEKENIVQAWAHGVKYLTTKPNLALKDLAEVPEKIVQKAGRAVGAGVKGVSKTAGRSMIPLIVLAGLGLAAYIGTPFILKSIRKGAR
jgi:hypothetical protein